MSFDTRDLRNALGCFATGVCVVTARAVGGQPFGLTINSFASVSLEPPLILWSLDRSSDTFADFAHVDRFAVSVLPDSGREISQKLARKGRHSLDGVPLIETRDGPPVLRHAIAWFACRTAQRLDGGDHVIFLGRVEEFRYAREGHPLVYYRGRYRGLADG